MTEMSPAEEVFFAALEKATPAERAAYLDKACADNPALRARVEKLLAAHPRVGDFLEPPAARGDAGPKSGEAKSTVSYAPTAAAGIIVAGKYKLLQKIGEGGMGEVWMADQTEPVKRRVAVKLIRVERGNSKAIVSRFEAERQAIALMDHPHIAKLLDAGITGEPGGVSPGSPFFVMELVKGIPLTEFCDVHKLSIPQRLDLFTQICSAVQHAHQKGIIHRDLKPTNILVESHDGKPVPKVIDFGLAKATSGMQLTEQTLFTAFGTVMGTPLYMAPEQANFNAVDVDTRADVYALGAILYELLTGTTPIARDSLKRAALDEILKLIREQEAPTPSSRLSSPGASPNVAANRQMEPDKLGRFVKGELDWIVMKALAKERDRRYETANGFAKDIERFLNHEPVQAGPPTAAYRMTKFVRRNRGPVIAGSLVLFALLMGMAGTTWGLFEAKWQAAIARAETTEKEKARLAEAARAEGERRAKLDAQAAEKLAGERLVQVNAEKKKTEAEKQVALAVRDFLQHKLLGQANVEFQADALLGAGGLATDALENPTIRELLDRAAKELTPDKIDTSFPQQPLVQAAILQTVGRTYMGVGEYDRAIGFLQRSLALYRQHLGPNDANTLSSMSNLATAYDFAGKLDLSLPLCQETLKLKIAKLGPDHLNTLIGMANLAAAYERAGKVDLALPLAEEALKLFKSKFGPGNPNTLSSMNLLALVYDSAGKQSRVLPLLEETLKLRRVKLGPDHPATLLSMNNLAAAYEAGGKLDIALSLHEEALKLTKAKLGPEHPTTLLGLNNIARVYIRAGKPDLAVPLLLEALKISKAKLGPDHPTTLLSMNNLAQAYSAADKRDLALPLTEEVLKLAKNKFGPGHRKTLTAMNNLAMAYLTAGKTDLALPLSKEILELSKAKLGPDHPDTLLAMGNLVSVYKAAGKLGQAVRIAEERLEQSKAKLGPDHPDTLRGMSKLAIAYGDVGKLDLALPLFEEVLELSKIKLGPEHPETLLNMNNLANAYTHAGKLGKAVPLAEETLRLRKALSGPEHSETLTSMSNLAIAYHAAGKPALALPLFEETLKIQKVKLGPEHPTTLTSMNNLAQAYSSAKKPALALPLFEVTLKLMKARLGSDHPETLACMNNLALAYQESGKLDLALPLSEETLRLKKAKLGPEHPDTLTSMNNLALTYQAAGKLDLALPLFEQTLEIRTAKLGSEHPDTLLSMTNLAAANWRAKQLDKSVPLFEEALKIQERTLGRNHADTLLTVANLGVNYKDAGRLAEALPLLEESYRATKKHPQLRFAIQSLVDVYAKAGENGKIANVLQEQLTEARKALPKDSPQLASILAQTGMGLLVLDKRSDAEPFLRECLAIREKSQPDAWNTFNTKSQLGGALLGQKNYADAEPLLLAGYEGMKEREKTLPPLGKIRLPEALDRLVQLYEATGKKDEAAKWRLERAKYPEVAPMPQEKK